MTERDNSADEDREDVADQLRMAVASAYSFVKGQELVDSFDAVTFEELLDAQISRIEGPGTSIRPNVLDRVRKVKEDLLAAVSEIKKQPDSFFQRPTSSFTYEEDTE